MRADLIIIRIRFHGLVQTRDGCDILGCRIDVISGSVKKVEHAPGSKSTVFFQNHGSYHWMQQGNLFLDKTLNVDMALANVDPLESSLVDGITVFCV